MTIALLCPSRGRPEQLKRMIESVRRTAVNNILVFNALSKEDIANYGRAGIPSLEDYYWGMLETPENLPTAQKWNLLAQGALNNANNKLFMLASDDMIFDTQGWDEALINHYNSLENKIHVYALQDSRDENGTPHPIVTREWIEAMGYAFPPIFLHWYLDTWTVEIAKANNCFTHFKDYKLIHDKPSDRGQADETHSRIREWGWNARDMYVNETCKHFLELEKKRLALKINKL